MYALYADKLGNGSFLGWFGANCCLFRLTICSIRTWYGITKILNLRGSQKDYLRRVRKILQDSRLSVALLVVIQWGNEYNNTILKTRLGELTLNNLARFSPCSNRYLVAGEMHPSFQACPGADPVNVIFMLIIYVAQGQFFRKTTGSPLSVNECFAREILAAKIIGPKTAF